MGGNYLRTCHFGRSGGTNGPLINSSDTTHTTHPQLALANGSVTTYQYDALNRLTSVTQSHEPTALSALTYDALSRRTQLQLANGTSTTYQYDAINRLLSLTSSLAALTSSATYDPVGNRTALTDAAGTHGYTYDKLSQLTVADYPTGFAFADTTFTYDKLGNRTQVLAGTTTAYAANTVNQYTTVGGTAFTYDPNGNLTSDGTNAYTYDSENRLLTAQGSGLGAQYTYDPLGRRLTKTVNGTTTRFLYDGEQLLAETDATGTITATYVYGTPRITDGAGNVLPQSVVGNRFLFTGRESEQETGLYYYRARYYNPAIGRFLQRDPVGYTAGINLYSYVDNNPLNWVDPFGLDKQRSGRESQTTTILLPGIYPSGPRFVHQEASGRRYWSSSARPTPAPGPSPMESVVATAGTYYNDPGRILRTGGRVVSEVGPPSPYSVQWFSGRVMGIGGLALEPGGTGHIVGLAAGGTIGAAAGRYFGGAIGGIGGAIIGGTFFGWVGSWFDSPHDATPE